MWWSIQVPRTLQIPTPRAYLPLLAPSRYKGLYGGRGSGKSHEFAKALIEKHVMEPGMRAVCIREVQKSLDQSVKRLLEDKIKEFALEKDFRITNTHIEAPGKGIITFQGMQNHTAESIKSLEGFKIGWVEEAQSLSQRSLDLLRPTIRTEGSELWFSWNPRKPNDPVDQFLRGEHVPPGAIIIGTTYRDNPWFPEVLRQEMEWDQKRNPDKYAHIWLGEYERHSEARVFKNWTIDAFDTPDDVTLLFGGDWGFSIDPSVLVRCWVRGRTLFIDHEAYKIGVEIDHIPALFDTVPKSREWPIVADSARPETIAYLKRHGFPRIEPAKKGPDSVKEGVIFLQNYDIVVHPRCVHAIDELTMYAYKQDKLTGIITPFLQDVKNHVIDSLRYAVERLRQPEPVLQEATWGR